MRAGVARLLLLVALLGGGGGVQAQLRPENVLVVIDVKTPDSVAVGEYYVKRRRIPAENVARVSFGSARQRTSWQAFKANVLEPVLAHIEAKRMGRRVHMIVLTKGIPYDVEGEAATWMFYARGVRWRQVNPYFGAGRPLDAARDFGPGRYPAVMVTGFTAADAKAVVDRGVSSDGTHPRGTVYFLRGTGARALRRGQAPEAAAELELMGVGSALLNGASIENRPDVLGYFTGATRVKTKNRYLPGAFADHLTSFGGVLYEEKGQMSILEFIRDGATGSCGTVSEPLSQSRKFPHARFYTAYARGFTLGEAMWQSVGAPYQVIFVGDPLACPFARKGPAMAVERVDGGKGGKAVFRVGADAGEWGHRVAGVLMSVDGQSALAVSGPGAGSDTRLILTFSQAGPGGGDERGKARVSVTTMLPAGQAPAVGMKKMAERINALAGISVRATALGNSLDLVCGPGEETAPFFLCECRGAGGGAPGWRPLERVCRFRGYSRAQPARAVMFVRGEAQRAFTARLALDGVERRVKVEAGWTAFDILEALVKAFANEERVTGADGLRLAVRKSAQGRADIIVHARKAGPEWNGREVALHARTKGTGMVPHGGRLRLLGGTAARAGRYRLTLLPNAAAGGKTHILIGDKRITLTHGGGESLPELVSQCASELRRHAPEVRARVSGLRVLLRSDADEPPALGVESDSPTFTAEFLGGRWARLRGFPPLKEGEGPLRTGWLAILSVRRGFRRVQTEVALDLSRLPRGEHRLVFRAPCEGPWPAMAEAVVRLAPRHPPPKE